MNILGLSAYYHDAAAALVRDGRIVAAAEEERFSRIKHDPSLPVRAARYCLEEAGLGIDDIDLCVFYEKPLRKFERLLTTSLGTFPRGGGGFVRGLRKWLGGRLWLKGEIAAELGIDPVRIRFVEHHVSHGASAFFTSPFSEAAVVTVDGVGEWATTTIMKGASSPDGHRLDPLKELHFPHSIGLLYSVITAYLGFEVNEGEYKVMGLAAYGQPRFRDQFGKLVRIGEDGSLELDMRYFAFHRNPTKGFTSALEALLGPARQPGQPLDPTSGDPEGCRFADVAATLQQVTEEYLLALCREARRATGARCLALAGGVALNSVANTRIQRESGFEEVYVQPSAGDPGGALGAALYASHVIHGETRQEPLRHAFLGRGWSQAEVRAVLDACRVRYRTFDSDAELDQEVAGLLAEGAVGGWFQGRFEWGPRALGGRSILADPRRPEMVDRVNRKVKYREPFRPFAPAVLESEAGRWFELTQDRPDHLTPFMLAVVPVTPEGRASLPAVTHVDATARVQTVNPVHNPRFHNLIEAFRERTGVGVLLNTSMNLKGEPICQGPLEALSVFERSDLDFLALERCLVRKAA
jgi:carbamoyltransferase